jgi:hypothetical protein
LENNGDSIFDVLENNGDSIFDPEEDGGRKQPIPENIYAP